MQPKNVLCKPTRVKIIDKLTAWMYIYMGEAAFLRKEILMIKIQELYDLSHTLAGDYLVNFEYPWQALSGIKNLILELGEKLNDEYTQVSSHVWVHKSARIAPTAYLGSPCIIGAGTEVRHCAFIRGSALVGENCVVGNSVELKNVILFDNVQVPHYNYVGDSIPG